MLDKQTEWLYNMSIKFDNFCLYIDNLLSAPVESNRTERTGKCENHFEVAVIDLFLIKDNE